MFSVLFGRFYLSLFEFFHFFYSFYYQFFLPSLFFLLFPRFLKPNQCQTIFFTYYSIIFYFILKAFFGLVLRQVLRVGYIRCSLDILFRNPSTSGKMAPFPEIQSKHSLVAKHVTEEVRSRYILFLGDIYIYIPYPVLKSNISLQFIIT